MTGLCADGSRKPYKRSAGTRGKAKDREELARLKGLLAQCHKDDFMQAAYLYGCICDIVGLTSPSGAAPYPRACRVCGWYGHNRLQCPRYASQQAAAAANEKSKCEYTSPLDGEPHCGLCEPAHASKLRALISNRVSERCRARRRRAPIRAA